MLLNTRKIWNKWLYSYVFGITRYLIFFYLSSYKVLSAWKNISNFFKSNTLNFFYMLRCFFYMVRCFFYMLRFLICWDDAEILYMLRLPHLKTFSKSYLLNWREFDIARCMAFYVYRKLKNMWSAEEGSQRGTRIFSCERPVDAEQQETENSRIIL